MWSNSFHPGQPGHQDTGWTDPHWTLHCGQIMVIRQTLILGAKISSFVGVLGLYGQVKMGLDVWNHVHHLFTL